MATAGVSSHPPENSHNANAHHTRIWATESTKGTAGGHPNELRHCTGDGGDEIKEREGEGG